MWFRTLFDTLLARSSRTRSRKRRLAPSFRRRSHSFRPLLESLEDRCLLSSAILQTNLVTDSQSYLQTQGYTPAKVEDMNLVNPWGLAASPTKDWWVANAGTASTTLYNTSTSPPDAPMKGPVFGVPGIPTGIVYHDPSAEGGNEFDLNQGDTSTSSEFLFASVDGTISGWAPGMTNAVPVVPSNGAVYTGLAIATDSQGQGNTRLYAADFAGGKIDVYNQNFKLLPTPTGNFTDSQLPDGYSPFNIQAIGNQLYVEYAPADKVLNGEAAAGDGAVDVYNTHGQLQQRLIAPDNPHLNDPWAVAMAPSNYGSFSNDLLVGNFGDGTINAFDPNNGHFVGELKDATGQPIAIPHLWGLAFGNGHNAGPTNTLYFTAGLSSHLADPFGPPQWHGLFGSLTVMPPAVEEAMTVNGSVPVSASNNSVGTSSSPPSFSSEQDQRIDTFFGSFNAMLASLESRLEMMDPQLSPFLSMFNADLDALETMIVNM